MAEAQSNWNRSWPLLWGIIESFWKYINNKCSAEVTLACYSMKMITEMWILQDLLLQLDHCKSMGPKGILRVLKQLADVNYRASLNDSSMFLGILKGPSSFEAANIVPVSKKGRKDKPGNCRPATVSFQWLTKFWRLLCEVLKNTWRITVTGHS